MDTKTKVLSVAAANELVSEIERLKQENEKLRKVATELYDLARHEFLCSCDDCAFCSLRKDVVSALQSESDKEIK